MGTFFFSGSDQSVAYACAFSGRRRATTLATATTRRTTPTRTATTRTCRRRWAPAWSLRRHRPISCYLRHPPQQVRVSRDLLNGPYSNIFTAYSEWQWFASKRRKTIALCLLFNVFKFYISCFFFPYSIIILFTLFRYQLSGNKGFKNYVKNYVKARMWANAQRDGRPAECRCRPLFNAAKFGWRPLLECRA